MQQRQIILAIETSCDETGLALVEAEGGLANPRFHVLENLVASQIPVHRPFGGVVPTLAKREHTKNIPILFRKLTRELRIHDPGFKNRFINHKSSFINLATLDMIAVTVGPGLEPALWTGITFAQSLHDKLKNQISNLKIIGVNHLEGHLYSFLLPQKARSSGFKIRGKQLRTSSNSNISIVFPAVALIVSGGHTILLLMESLTKWKKLGETRDDAAGEAFDKVGRMLGLPYPGGPEIEKIGKRGKGKAILFPRPMINQKNYDFSFAGLKTAVHYYLRNLRLQLHPNVPKSERRIIRDIQVNLDFSDRVQSDIAASFQQAVIDVLVHKTMRAVSEFNARSVILCGGVAANRALRNTFKAKTRKRKVRFFVPPMEYNTDNAAMIAAAAYMNYLTGKKYRFAARGDMNI